MNVEGTRIKFDRTGVGIGFFHDKQLTNDDVKTVVLKDRMEWVVDVKVETSYQPIDLPPFTCQEIGDGKKDTFTLKEESSISDWRSFRLSHKLGKPEEAISVAIDSDYLSMHPFAVINVADLPLAFLWHDTALNVNLKWDTTWRLTEGIMKKYILMKEIRPVITDVLHVMFEIHLDCENRII